MAEYVSKALHPVFLIVGSVNAFIHWEPGCDVMLREDFCKLRTPSSRMKSGSSKHAHARKMHFRITHPLHPWIEAHVRDPTPCCLSTFRVTVTELEQSSIQESWWVPFCRGLGDRLGVFARWVVHPRAGAKKQLALQEKTEVSSAPPTWCLSFWFS